MYRTTFIGAALIALLPLTAPSAPAVSAGGSVADAQQAATYKVTAKANMTVAIAREDTIIIRGRVTPEAAGQVVLLQQKVGKTSWKNSGKAKIKAAGTYVLKDKPTTSGVRFYRVVKPASEGLRRGISKSLEVGVFAWQKLARLAPSASTGISVAGVTVAADHLSPSLVASTPGTPGYVEFTLGRRCVALVATYALTDASASGATGTISVSTDGTNRLTQPLAVGTIVRNHVIDLIDVFRIRFDMTSSGTPAAYPAVVVPWVLCI